MNAGVGASLSLLLRALSMGGKFLLMLVVARLFSLEELGQFALVGATVSLGVYVAGLDFYNFAIREMLHAGPRERERMILDQFRVYLANYALAPLLLTLVFASGVLDWRWAPLTYLLLLAEHASQELVRLLVATGAPLRAGVVLFLRSASWAYLAIPVVTVSPEFRHAAFLLGSWLVMSTGAVILGAVLLGGVHWSRLLSPPQSIKWIARGMRVALPFLAATLALRAIFTLDRYVLEWTASTALVGVYGLYLAFGTVLVAIVDAAVVQMQYPKLVALANDNMWPQFRRALRIFAVSVLACIAAVLGLALLLANPLFALLAKPEFHDHLDAFWILLGAHALLCASQVPHFALYALNRDRWIIAGHVVPLLVFLGLVIVSGTNLDLSMMAVAIAISMGAMFVVKYAGLHGRIPQASGTGSTNV